MFGGKDMSQANDQTGGPDPHSSVQMSEVDSNDGLVVISTSEEPSSAIGGRGNSLNQINASSNLKYFWLSAPYPIVPRSVKAINQALHLMEPLIVVLSLQIAKNRMMSFIAMCKTAAFIQRSRKGDHQSLWTIGITLWSVVMHKLFVRKKSLVRSPFSFLVTSLTPLQFLTWSLCNSSTTLGTVVRSSMLLSISGISELISRAFRTRKKLGTFPKTKNEVTKGYVTMALQGNGILDSNNGNDVASVEVATLSGKEGSGNASEQQGFIGEICRVKIKYSGDSDVPVPESVVVKFASNSPLMRAKLRLVNVYLREAFFYSKIAPKLYNWNGSNVGNVLMVPTVYRVDYDDGLAISTIMLEDASPLKAGDELTGANWQQACAVALRYARFHSLHWSTSLNELGSKFPELAIYRAYDWMDINSNFIDKLLRDSFEEMMGEEDLIDMVDPYMQRLLSSFINNFDIYLKHQKTGPVTLIHADARMENMLWPDIETYNKTSSVKCRDETVFMPGMDFDDQYDRLGLRWLAVDWQTCTKGKGVYDLAYFVAMDLEVSEEFDDSDVPDKLLVRAYHAELLRNSKRARDIDYSFEQCWHDYRMSTLMAILIPIAVMRPQSIGSNGLLRAKAVRRSMFRRCLKTIRRVGADQLFFNFVNSERKHKSLSAKISPLDPEELEAARVPSPKDEVMLANLEVDHFENRNSYDRWFFNGYSPDGAVFFAAAFGMYPGRQVVDASFAVTVAGRQHNIRTSRKLSHHRDISKESDANSLYFFESSVGPIRIIVQDPLSSVSLQVNLPNERIHAELTFTRRFPAHLEPHYSMNIKGAGRMEYDRMTQLVSWDGFINIKDHSVQVVSWFGCRDRSWGVRPHPTADKSPGNNMRRNKLLANSHSRWVLNRLIPQSYAQFYWLWCPLNFERCAMVYHTQQNMYGKSLNRSASILGEIPSIPSTTADSSQRVSVDSEYHVLPKEEAETNESKFESNPKVAAAGHSLVYQPFSRHAKAGSIFMTLDDGRTVKIKFEPMFPFFMSGIGYGHPQFGHGTSHGDAKLVVQYDTIDIELADRRNPLYWHVQEVCHIAAYFPNSSIPFDEGIGMVEQLMVGPHLPSKFTKLYDT